MSTEMRRRFIVDDLGRNRRVSLSVEGLLKLKSEQAFFHIVEERVYNNLNQTEVKHD